MNKDNRRIALKTLAAAVPAVWVKPVVNSVILPVHASTSPSGPPCLTTGVVQGPVASTGNDFGGSNIANLFNQSGLSAGYTSGVTGFASYNPTHSNSAAGDFFASSPSFPGNLDFDLGSSFLILSVAIWNDSQVEAVDPSTRGIRDFDVYTDDNSAFSSPTFVGSFTAMGEEVETSAKQTFDLTNSVGQFVRLTINSNHGSTFFIQVGEIAFEVCATA